MRHGKGVSAGRRRPGSSAPTPVDTTEYGVRRAVDCEVVEPKKLYDTQPESAENRGEPRVRGRLSLGSIRVRAG